MNNEMEGIWKGTLIKHFRYNPRIRVKIEKTDGNLARRAGVPAEIRKEILYTRTQLYRCTKPASS
jgi:hypothetical protein